MSDVQWVRVSRAEDIGRIAKIKRGNCNTYSVTSDKTGAALFSLGHDSRPDSDWGRYTRGNIIIRVTDDALLAPAEAAIRQLLGWPEDNSIFNTGAPQ